MHKSRKPLLKRIASDLSINLKLLEAEVNIGAKGSTSDETRYAKVKIVSEYIEKHLDVGSIDAPSTYFKGTLLMQYVFLEEDEVVYFGSVTPQTVVGLGGSLKHVIGSTRAENNRQPNSTLYALLRVFQSVSDSNFSFETTNPQNIERVKDTGLRLIERVTMHITHRQKIGQQLEFLAKTLIQGPLPHYHHPYVVLGTPIYVAIND
ncbi:MAG: DUF7019 family protein [Ktedonobacteraceae bacterium]